MLSLPLAPLPQPGIALSVPGVLHPGDRLPHPAGLEVSPLLFWAVVAVVVAIVVWLLLDLSAGTAEQGDRHTADRSGQPGRGTAADDDLGVIAGEALVVGRPRRSPGVAARATDPDAPAVAAAPLAVSATADPEPAPRAGPPATPWPTVATGKAAATAGPSPPVSTPWNPVRALALVLGVAMGMAAIEQARAVEALVAFVRSDNAAQVGRLAFAFGALALVGGALAVPAPRVAAAAFGAAGAIGLALASAPRWEERARWWDAAYVLGPWPHLAYWAAAAFGLSALATLGAVYRPRHAPARPRRRGFRPRGLRRWLWSP